VKSWLIASAVLVATLVGPTSTAFAGAWTLEEGKIWSKAALLYLRSSSLFADQNDERFGLTGCVDGAGNPVTISAGDRRPYDCTTGGTFQVAAIYWDTYFGITDELDLIVQIPFILHTQFENDSGLDGSDAGLGDIRVGAQYRYLADPVVLALYFAVKAPTGNFTTNEAVPPLGQGQWDLTWRALIGRSFGRFYAGADIGYRLRLTNPDTGINVGDEILVNLEGGVTIWKWISFQTGGDLLWGFESEEEGAPTNRPRRWVLHVRGTLSLAFHEHFGMELGLRWPVAGEGWPADPVFGIALYGKTPKLWDWGG
jgi:hypothetical protein